MEDNLETQIYENKKRELKVRKKDPRAYTNISKSFGEMTDSQKFATLETKYNDLYNEYRNMDLRCQHLGGKLTSVVKEKDSFAVELNKSVDIRSRLENVCRELQKQNKLIKEENMAKLKLEEDRRKEVTTQFQKTLNDINVMMDENLTTNVKLRDDNQDMSSKIADLYAQFNAREGDLKKLHHQMELEKQLARATVEKTDIQLKAEKEMWKKEREVLEESLKKSDGNCKMLSQTVKKLEEHLDIYKAQYESFEGTISKSSRMFDDCKSEMTKMSKKIAVLEKDCVTWKQRFENAAQTIIQLTTENHKLQQEIAKHNKKLGQLQKLCRQLQLDRAAYLKLLKNNGIEPVSETIEVECDLPGGKATKKESELANLQQELALLQSQLGLVQGDEASDTPAENTKSAPKKKTAKKNAGVLNEIDTNITTEPEPSVACDNVV